MRLILDRIEKTAYGKRIAIFEKDDGFIEISEDNMPSDLIDKLKVGDVIDEIKGERIISAKILEAETASRRKEMKSRLGNLFNRKK